MYLPFDDFICDECRPSVSIKQNDSFWAFQTKLNCFSEPTPLVLIIVRHDYDTNRTIFLLTALALSAIDFHLKRKKMWEWQ